MKPICLLVLAACCLLSCGTRQKKQLAPDVSDPMYRLHDIWVAEAIDGRDFSDWADSETLARPRLELFVAEKRLVGNDSCNEIFGDISRVDAQHIGFTRITSTRKLCSKMLLPDAFVKALKASDHYEIKNLRLHLFDTQGREVLRLRKVD